jgi:tRNA-specific 2-thiouridylase
MHEAERTLVAMSGGVDSSTVAALLAEAGESLVGVFMRNGVRGAASSRSCCSLSDARDARAVADYLGLPFYVQDLERSFDRLIGDFAGDYAAGLTPNPCVVCNNELKFGELLQLADDLGCRWVATGHYARTDGQRLLRGIDRDKDQSYLLHGLRPDQLGRARFPLGGMTKSEVRRHAGRLGLPVADKRDSADICFVPGGDYRAVVEARLGHRGRSGELRDAEGRTLGRHTGVADFTVGQRRGLGLALGRPAFVTSIDPASGTVTVGTDRQLLRAGCRVGAVGWLTEPAWGQPVQVQLRHHHQPEAATLAPEEEGTVRVQFEHPSSAVTPGQYAVFYSAEQVLGGGRILRGR